MRFVPRFLLFIMIAAASGCTPNCDLIPTEGTSASHGTNGGSDNNGGSIPSTAGEGEWSYSVNGVKYTHVQRTKYELSDASVILAPVQSAPAGALLLEVLLDLPSMPSPGLPKLVQFYVITMHVDTGTYPCVSTIDSLGVTAYFTYDTIGKYGETGGTLHIVKYDTTDGVISGTFSMRARKPFAPTSPEDTIAGYFNDVPINTGGFRHGSISGTGNGNTFITADDDTAMATAYTIAGDSTMIITCTATSLASNGSTDYHSLHFFLVNPHAGTFQIGGNTGEVATSYSFNSGQILLDTKYGAIGSLSITAFDTIRHRIQGTFEISGQSYPSGTPASLTGTIDNVYFYYQ